MREFSRTSMGIDAFRQFCDEVYNIDEDQTFRKRDRSLIVHLCPAMAGSMRLGLSGLASMPSHK